MTEEFLLMIRKRVATLVASLSVMYSLPAHSDVLTLYAAGSLKAAMSDVVSAYEKEYKTVVNTKFGPSGLLRKAIEKGAQPDVFASANMAHPRKLASQQWGSPVVMFAGNQLCALAQPELNLTSDNLLRTLLDDNVKVGTSTPKADPSGDYAWRLFEKAEQIKSGSFEMLSFKALQLTGGTDSAKVPKGLNQYGWVMSEKKADVFLTYCTNAVLAKKQVKDLQIISVPTELSVGADYGLIVRDGAPKHASQLAMYILSSAGQIILQSYGFKAVAVPK
ncbi:molybdate ABC transporter substrate-binding protein [Oceanospirillum linum]|nr:molybdate ABC transporter substrate-binding protein [Oceanospirillum linum]